MLLQIYSLKRSIFIGLIVFVLIVTPVIFKTILPITVTDLFAQEENTTVENNTYTELSQQENLILENNAYTEVALEEDFTLENNTYTEVIPEEELTLEDNNYTEVIPEEDLSLQDISYLENNTYIESAQELAQEDYIPNTNQQQLAQSSAYYAILPRPTIVAKTVTSPYYIPQQTIVNVHPSNYEPRSSEDIYGKPINNQMIVVLHETVGSATSAINTFRTNNTNESNQVSYHALIKLDGSVVYLVPPEMRAFGAGNSVFKGKFGEETVRLHPTFPSSVNNFAYHVSLETPADGRGNQRSHSGYTFQQYQSLAWLIGQTNIPEDRITTHQAVDRSGMRKDPRSFDFSKFLSLLQVYRVNNSPSMIRG